jgi:hypothetical protein
MALSMLQIFLLFLSGVVTAFIGMHVYCFFYDTSLASAAQVLSMVDNCEDAVSKSKTFLNHLRHAGKEINTEMDTHIRAAIKVRDETQDLVGQLKDIVKQLDNATIKEANDAGTTYLISFGHAENGENVLR